MKKQTAGRENLVKLAPKFAELNDDVLFGEIWSREEAVEIVTQLAFYSGWPKAWSAFALIKEVYGDEETKEVFIANVTFEPRCRNNWHIHHSTNGGGQILICVDGEGWYQEEGKEAIRLKPGDVITIPANVKHWHGATSKSWFSHIAVEVPGENTSNEWCEKVSDEEYNKLPE